MVTVGLKGASPYPKRQANLQEQPYIVFGKALESKNITLHIHNAQGQQEIGKKVPE